MFYVILQSLEVGTASYVYGPYTRSEAYDEYDNRMEVHGKMGKFEIQVVEKVPPRGIHQ